MTDRRTETEYEDASDEYMLGFAAALAAVARVQGATAAMIQGALAEHELTLDDLAEAGAEETDIEELRRLVG
jgi:hypothetical protein